MSANPNREWNYHPDLPLANKSVFHWPPKPAFLARWFRRNWVSLSERVILLLIAIGAWQYLYPSLDSAKVFAFGWIAQTYLINVMLMLIVAGGLHWYFYTANTNGPQI